ncbi:MAG: 50S ribosomal protein L5 [Candidatus Campbellbacteria bacterium]|nr:50S ribosomal protein L5 [Candidatus Campbellbacteria bacterium]
MLTVKEKQNKAFEALKETLGVKNPMAVPRVSKVIVSVGTGSAKDKNKIEVIQDRLMKITGQKPAGRVAKKSIASFKLREGQVIGYQITLRGDRMYDFLDRLINIALPRTRDFRGIERDSIDPMGNITIGIKEHTIFPETADEEIRDVFGLAVSIVTTAKNKETAEKYLEYIGIPFKKAGEVKAKKTPAKK